MSYSELWQWVKDDPDLHLRRAVWTATSIILIVAGVFYGIKAAEDRSAFVRWRHQVLQLDQGVNIYDEMFFPTPPIMALMLYPMMLPPPVVGALIWFVLKGVMAVASALLCFRMAREAGQRVPSWVEGLVLFLACRPILSDLHHGNNNLLILFLIVFSLYSWTKGRDGWTGLALALAISCKVTPALFVPYFLYKRSWKTVGWTFFGLFLFFFVVPSLFLGPAFNLELLVMWWNRIIRPFVSENVVGAMEINQSMVGLVTRLLTEGKADGRYGTRLDVNILSLDPQLVAMIAKGLALGFVGLLAFLCRTKTTRRDDPRLLGEFSLVVLTMLFVSERSWKHHYVTLILPFSYLVMRACMADVGPRARAALIASLAGAMLLMATTSSELGGWLAGGQGHKLAQAYGMFFWAGAVLYAATAWRVRVERAEAPRWLDLSWSFGRAWSEPVPMPHLFKSTVLP